MSVAPTISSDNLVSLNNELLFNIAAEHPVENMVFSPTFTKLALFLLYQGAAGNTEEEFQTVLRITNKTKEDVANDFRLLLTKIKSDHVRFFPHTCIFVSPQLKIADSFKDLARSSFATPIISIKFENSAEATETVNRWIEEQSRKKLPNFYIKSNFSPDTKALMVSLVYFKGKWAQQFDLTKTKRSEFKLTKDKTIDVDIMYLFARLRYGEVKSLNAHALELPFEDSEISMLILLPNDIEGLNSMEHNLLDYDFHKEWRKLNFHDIRVQMPKFHYLFNVTLKTTLYEMGLQSLFTKDSNMQNLLENPEQTMSFVDLKHIAFIEIDEFGSRVTGESVVSVSEKSKTHRLSENSVIYDFIVDHPFFFVVRDPDHIYFTGHVANLKEDKDKRMSEST